jgi:sterol desaturase/sphingolipid hydroxylase (fatty acid hydroxylase superfamily)
MDRSEMRQRAPDQSHRSAVRGNTHGAISRPVRLFKSDLIERLTRTHLATLVLFWLSASVALLVLGIRQGELAGSEACTIALAGVVGWSLAEYLLHRFVFHLDRWIPSAQRFCFLMHGCHHADPSDAGRDVMPLIASVPAFGTFLGAAMSILGAAQGLVFCGGFGLAYLAYDIMHYGFHQWPFRGHLGTYLKRHHLMHHFRDDRGDFGVTSPIWDWVFGTLRNSRL